MKRIFITLTFLFGITLSLFAQSTREELVNNDRDFLYVVTKVDTKAEVNALSRNFSVDNCPFDERTGQYAVRIYLARHEYDAFAALNLPFEIIAAERPSAMVTDDINDFTTNWNKYPSYEVYVELMQRFQQNFPQLCKIDTILAATPCTQRPHMLMAAHISTTLGQHVDKPAFLYSATMHGDEVVGYYMMLRLIDYILNNATTDPMVQNVLNNVDLYICPLENPDGTYHSANDRISSSYSTRYNWNNVDMNRNYPYLPGVSGSANVQPETQAYINWVQDKHFVMSVNFHGGAELTNFPWDTWASNTRMHADDAWFRYICQNYVDDCQAIDPTYMVGETAYNPGCGAVTEGGDWYEITGSRQDYMNYYQHCREVTMEVHFDKVVTSSSELPSYWTNSKNALLNYVMECTYGFRGIVTDAVTGEPIEAKIFVENHDTFNSEVYSHLPVGAYYRPIKAGTYTVTVSADCYESQTFTITTTDGASVRRDVQLQPLVSAPQVADQHILAGQTATLTANSTHTIKWYNSATATNPIATGNTYTTPALTQTTVYYVEEQATNNGTTCVSERTSATVYVTEGAHDTVHGYLTVDTCDSYTINGQTYTVSGCYLITFPYGGQNYADSILHLSLNIHSSYEITVQETHMVGETYYVGGIAHTADEAGTFTYDLTLHTQFGCDSIVHYIIQVNAIPASYSDLSLTDCGFIIYENETYTESGNYNIVYPGAAANHGDSILILHLTIYPTYDINVSEIVSVGDTYYVEGQPYTAIMAGTFTYDRFHATEHGCDSIIHYIFYVSDANFTFGELTLDECIPFSYEGQILTMDGDYTFFYPGAGVNGADSTLVIHLTLHPSYEMTVEVHLALGEHYDLDGYDFYSEQEGIYPFDKEYESAFGCDSIVHYNLIVGNVGIDEMKDGKPFITPNPTTDQCHINGLQEGSNVEVRIFNTYGQLVKSVIVDAQQATINLESLNSGTYFIQMIENRGITTQKIIKL